MVRVQLKGINKVHKKLSDGTVRLYYYHRATGRPLIGKPGSAEFVSSYADAEKSMRDRFLSATFAQLVRDYTLSEEYEKGLAMSTRSDYRRLLSYAEKEFGDLPMVALEDRRVRADFLQWRDRIAKTSGPRGADYRLSAISAMLTWAVDRGKLTTNHLKDFRRLYHSDRADLIWLPEHIQAFMAVAPIELQRALILALHTGQRQGDLLSLAWSTYDGTAITLRQSKARRRGKVGRLVTIPCTQALRNMLDSVPKNSTQILTMANDRPWKAYTFRHDWAETAAAANITKLHFNDLRGTAVTMLAEAGCSELEIATITGHSLVSVHSILEKYLSRTRHLAEAAIHKFENAERTRFANRLQTVTPRKKSDERD